MRSQKTVFSRDSRGFSLVELMITVAIIAVLTAIALVSFQKYTRKARTTEAYNMLGMIRMRQESYRSEFSQYCNVSGGNTNYWPTVADSTSHDWYAGLPDPWTQLGVRPSGQVYYQYSVVADMPPNAPAIAGAAPADLGYSTLPTQDAWWVAQARGDLNSNMVYSLFESASFTSGTFRQNETE
jgi:prepilin-type N-terminal cleavage/methylation domain-containing protein